MKLPLFLCLAGLLGGAALPPAAAAEHVEAALVAEHTSWLPGAPNWVALRLKPEPGWHTYWVNPGDSGLATGLRWTLPEGWRAGDIAWPYPERQPLAELVNYGYSEETLHLVPIQVPARPLGAQATVQAEARWLVCKDICIPGSAQLSLTLPFSEIATADLAWAQRFADTRARLPSAEPLRGTFDVAGGEVRVQWQSVDALAGVASVEFFPYDNALVNHAAPQRVALESPQLRIAQAQSPFFTGPPETVEGVLVVHGATTRAWSVSTTPGSVATVAASATPPAPAASALSAAPAAGAPGLLLVLGFALLGGLILNLMPCVFPVLSIKAVSVLEARRGNPAAERAHALAYAAGAIGSCVAVALALVLLRAGGQQLGWGFQLQSPVFVALLAYVMLVLGLSLSGLVQFGTSLMGVGQELAEQGGYAGSFFTGVLAVVVASPCTAPFMGTALGFAMTQPAPIALLVFAVLGFGLALPFTLLGFVPALGAWLPRPGHWMETFKQFMAFPLYLTAVGLMWVLGRQSGIDAVAIALGGMVLVAFGCWLWGAPGRGALRTALAVLGLGTALAVLAHPAFRTQIPPSAATPADGRESYSEQRLAELRREGRTVFVNFTADWCITCKVNEKAALDNERVKAAFAGHRVVWMTADWTRADPVITAALARFGRNGVPLYLLYPPQGEPEILPQILTPDLVVEAVTRVSSAQR